MNKNSFIRAGCQDVWNAFMVKGVDFRGRDIPYCPTTATILPKNLISYPEAKTIYNKHKHEKDFFIDAFVHFYIDDCKFDSPSSGIWADWKTALKILRHFAGIITPDFSTCLDFPEPLKLWNTYRMRAFGYWYGRQGGAVINNVRWGTGETFDYCFEGITTNSVVAIGTVASNLRNPANRNNFVIGFKRMLKILNPHTIIVYGSDKCKCFEEVRKKIKIIRFRSNKDLALRGDINV